MNKLTLFIHRNRKSIFILLLCTLLSSMGIAQPGAIDLSFNPGSGANDEVKSISLQQDGKIIIAGYFTSYRGVGRNRVARVNNDGTIDNTFNLGTGANSNIWSTSIQPDGKILIGGEFTSYNGTARNYIARLNADGSIDPSFNTGSGPGNFVTSISLQSDGKIIIVGGFSSFNGTSRNGIARLNSDGSLDATFNPGTGVNFTIWTSSIQADGKIIIGGSFTSFNGVGRIRVARLNTNGSLDNTFNPGLGAEHSFNPAYILTTLIQPDGKIIIGGYFNSYNGTARNYITRLNANGSLDATFNTGTGTDWQVNTTALQPDGKIIIGGQFTSYNGTARSRIARLNANGTLDATFNSTGTGFINATALQPDGKILIGGSFTSYNGTARNRVARVLNPPPYQATFTAMSTGSATWCAGETRTVSVTVTNIGSATWTNSGPDVNIGATWSNDLSYPWRVNANNLAPGQSQTYNITVTAPASPGSYTLQFDVVKEGDCWFGNNNGSCGPGNAAYVSAAQTVSGSIATATLTGGSICPPATGADVTLAASETGANYQLYKTIFKDDFETYTGWSTYGTGVVAQSSAQAQQGTFSLHKTTNGDPNGGIKAIGQTVGNTFLFEGWMLQASGTQSNRIAFLDGSGNGYSLRVTNTTIGVERRNAGVATVISSNVAWARPAGVWFRFVFTGNGNGTYTLNIYDIAGTLQASVTSNTDNTFNSFTQIAVVGGNDYHVDNIRLSIPQGGAVAGTGSPLVWSNIPVGEYQVYSGVTSNCSRVLSSVATVEQLTASTWYLDADNDNYYTTTQSACTSPGAGWTSTLPAGGSGDCDDNNAAINPGATEICGNSIDEDCSGSDLTCPTFTWTGNSNTLWNESGNWSGGNIPTATDNAIIPDVSGGSGNFPTINTAVSIADITIATNATLDISANQSLTVSGVLTNNGTITVASGGSLVQEDGSTLAGSGTYIVERAITAGQRFIGSPIESHSVNGFGIAPSGTNGGQIIPVTNPLYRCNVDSVSATSPYGNILELIENAAVIDNCAQSLWHVKSTGNLTDARGYAVNAAANTTLTFTGTVNNDDKTYGPLGRQTGSLDQWNGNNTTTRGWHLVSNPYPSPITFTNGSLGGSFDNQIQLFDGSSFTPFTLNSGPVTVAVGQGFQIRVATEGGSGTFSVNNNMRVAGNPTFYRQQSPFSQYVDITLSNSQYSDKSTVYFEDDATTAFDSKYDANRLFGAKHIPLLYTKETNGEYLAYNALPLLEAGNTQTVPVGIYDGSTPGEFTLSFDGITTLNATVMLEDLKLNTLQQVTEGSTYTFTTEAGDSRDRFLLHFEANLATGIAFSTKEGVRLFPNPTTGETNLILNENHGYSKAVIVDISGRMVQTYELNKTNTKETLNTASLNNGIYFIQLTGSNSNQTLKLIKQ